MFRPVVALRQAQHRPASPRTQPRPGSAKGTEPRSVPARRCARKPQRVNPQTRTASARAGAGGERTHNGAIMRRWGGAAATRSGAAADGRAAARLGAAWSRRSHHRGRPHHPPPQRSGGAEPPLPPPERVSAEVPRRRVAPERTEHLARRVAFQSTRRVRCVVRQLMMKRRRPTPSPSWQRLTGGAPLPEALARRVRKQTPCKGRRVET